MKRLLTTFSPKIRDQLLVRARNGRLRLGGERSDVAILESDIRGFTQLMAGRDADEIVELLNDYLSALVEAIFEFDGTIDKFVGDAILAVFGSPEPDARRYEKAIRAAAAMQISVERVNSRRTHRGLVTCNIGIGVHCGEVLHGFVGSADRMEFTIIGDAVNRAARYCAAAAAGEILVSPDLHQRAWRFIDAEPVTIDTKHEGEMRAYRVKGVKPSTA
jgi:adenylate cyclase